MSEPKHLAGLKIVLTGDFDAYERDEATRVLEGLGADVTGSVSGKTRVVFAGKNPGATKLGQARKRGLPVLGEPELVALVQGKTLDELLAGAAATASAGAGAAEPPKPALPLPFVEPPPRDGLYVERFAGSDQVRISGSYQAGLRHGSWKVFHENGQLREDYTWERGLKHGPELDWNADGTQTCDGRNERGKRVGTWTWWYPNGRFNQACTYDAQGLRQGEYRWDLEDGAPRARGAYLDDKNHGAWTWWHEGAWEKLERGYDRGAQHGPEAAWFPGGQLALRRGWRQGVKHGLEEVFDEQGKLTSRGEWQAGQAVGEHLRLDEAGHEVRTLFVDGLPEEVRADAKGREKVLKKLKKAKDHYAKADALGERVEYGQRAAFLLHLWRDGHLDVPADPDLWELLCEVAELVRGEEVVAFLRSAKTRDAYATVLPSWPDSLDRLVMEVYAREPGPIDAARDTLPGPMRAGVALVQARFGKPAGDALAGLLPALAAAHAERGLGPDIWWPGEGGLPEQRKLFLDYQGTRTELFDRLISFFGPFEDFVAELARHAFREAEESVARVSFSTFRPLVERATPEQLAALISGISLDNSTQELIRLALTEWRQDDGATLARIALEVKDTGLRKWPSVCVAILKLTEEGREIPPELLAALPLATESPTSSSEWYHGALRELDERLREDPNHVAARVGIGPGCAVPHTALLRRALSRLPAEAVRGVLERQMATHYAKTEAGQYLYLVDDPVLWRRFLELALADTYGHRDPCVYGLGDLGAKGLPLLAEALEAAKGKEWREGLGKAMLVALARAIEEQGDFPEEYDRFVRFDAIKDDYYHQFYLPFLQRIVHRLPTARAEEVLLRGLASNTFSRAFRMIASHPTRRVLEVAFRELLAREATFKAEQQRDVRAGLAALPGARGWVKWILQSGGGGGLGDALRETLGRQAFEELEKELREAGVAQAAQLDHVEKVRLRAEKAGGKGERIYLLRRLEGDLDRDDINLIGGLAPGVGASRWPRCEDEPMTHLFTLDLRSMPELAARVGEGVRAVSVFCLNPDHNEAYEAGTDQTAVVCTSEDELKAAEPPPEDVPALERRRYQAVAVDLAPTIWQEKGGDKELRGEIYRAGGRALGEPIWLQDEEHAGAFLAQFDESFVDMNLGDCGVMYVFADTAFWQCH